MGWRGSPWCSRPLSARARTCVCASYNTPLYRYTCVYICIYTHIQGAGHAGGSVPVPPPADKPYTGTRFLTHRWPIYLSIYLSIDRSIYLHVCVHIHVHIYTHIHVHICVYIRPHARPTVYVYIYMHIYICTYMYIHVAPAPSRPHARPPVYVYIYMHIYICTSAAHARLQPRAHRGHHGRVLPLLLYMTAAIYDCWYI